MDALQVFMSNELIQALGWTLLHSLWQGAAIALFLGVVLSFMSRQSAQLRYWISVTALLSLVALSISTFTYIYQPAVHNVDAALASANMTHQNITDAPIPMADEVGITFSNHPSSFVNYFEPHLPLFVAIWLLGICLFSLKFLGELAYTQHLKRYHCQPLPDEWQQRTKSIARKMGVRQAIQLKETLRIHSPMVIGFFRPAILFPIGLINSLTVAQVESIIAHEMAHIKRYDYLVNLLLSMVEILLFFNPMVWWISRRIRTEREFSCDDAAIQYTGDVVAFVKSLAQLEEWRLNPPSSLSMAFGGQKKGVLSRVQRVLKPNQPHHNPSKALLSVGVMSLCLGLLAFEPASERDSIPIIEAAPPAIEIMVNDSPEISSSDNHVIADIDQADQATEEVNTENSDDIESTEVDEGDLTVRATTDSIPEELKAIQLQINAVEQERNKLEREMNQREQEMDLKVNEIEQKVREQEFAQREVIHQLEREMREKQMAMEKVSYEFERKAMELEREAILLQKKANETDMARAQLDNEQLSPEAREQIRKKVIQQEKELREKENQLREQEILLEKAEYEKVFQMEKTLRETENKQFQLSQELELAENKFEQMGHEIEHQAELIEVEFEAKLEKLEAKLDQLYDKMHEIEKETRLGDQ